ncbi:hypothetical protein SEMRO_3451_G348160.1 [Seminavis robusta]|uniref:Uncharacterized protein n=1 Tax=Seminavis robusta TaxID=568900 RepID=A0A9N8F5L8_9STRA|nr:hypothetical protein SEMRO_3451_G348160.1 [Seminavis robusta]|eukprot:Sro3451_g348160.1 n/a (124) ;mRNA; f:517-888
MKKSYEAPQDDVRECFDYSTVGTHTKTQLKLMSAGEEDEDANLRHDVKLISGALLELIDAVDVVKETVVTYNDSVSRAFENTNKRIMDKKRAMHILDARRGSADVTLARLHCSFGNYSPRLAT